ncbi:MAG: class I tRNA ligase family protein [Alphaproteobacteria bacterium]|nr:class I tRNA ligase family protein [Alphaproteobacteria bacterium]
MSRPPGPPRPTFPARAVVTGGMPYGNKALHFGHIGGVFVQADAFARFLRDRIGADNVVFVSGTDCYGSPIVEHHRRMVEEQGYQGSLVDLVTEKHEQQKATLAAYQVAPDIFAASGLGRSGQVHAGISAWIFETLRANGHLQRLVTQQFYDPVRDAVLNGRQVQGRCPIDGCASEKAYADECSLGHQYLPKDLVDPKSMLSGTRPVLRDTSNWYLDLPKFKAALEAWADDLDGRRGSRRFAIAAIREFFGEPDVHIVERHADDLSAVRDQLPPHTEEPAKGKSITLRFASLPDRERACEQLGEAGIQFRTGKTLVPFRLTGDEEWGVPVPDTDESTGLTFWVWPESLWAPISFTATVLEARGGSVDDWRDWWCREDAAVFQFIGEDNVYFYGPAQSGLWLGTQGADFVADPPDGQLQLTDLVVNRHLQFLGTKASSSGAVKPPMADDLLEHYTAEQLRVHFFSMGLANRNISFRPKPLDPDADERAGDPVLKEGKVLTHAVNRLARSCFYGCQEHTDGRIPFGAVSAEVKERSDRALLDFERAMFDRAFPHAFTTIERYAKAATKDWHHRSQSAEGDEMAAVLVDAFHQLRVCTLMLHPIAPGGAERVRRQLQVDERFWSWDFAFEPLSAFIDDPATHRPLHLAPREDFWEQHESQLGS